MAGMSGYYGYIFGQLQKYGYRAVKDQGELFFQKRQGEKLLLLRIVPEALAGQNPPNLIREHSLLEQTAGHLMILQGSPVETLLLMSVGSNPSEDALEDMKAYNDVWFVHYRAERILIYENQKTDFYGLEAYLDDCNRRWNQENRDRKRRQFLSTFTPVNTALILINILVFLILMMLGDPEDASFMAEHGGMLYDCVVLGKEYYRLFTSMFIHFGIQHLGENMLMLLLTGCILERQLGKVRYLILYLLAGLASSASSLMFTLAGDPYTVSGGASGAIFGVLGGLLFIIIERAVVLKEKRLEDLSLRGMMFIIILGAGYGFTVSGVDNAAHIGGLIAGFLIAGIMEGIDKKKN